MSADPRPVQVLFVHGLESHPNGSKVRVLRSQGFDVTAPDMQMALWNLRRRNSAARQLLRSPELWVVAVGAVGVAIAGGSLTSAIGAGIAVSVWWSLRRRALFAAALGRSFDTSVEIQREAVRDLRPDVLVGSSWGGAVAAELIRRGHWSGPTVLLAPAIQKVGTWSGRADVSETLSALHAAPMPIVVFHDPTDTTIPYADSVALAGASRIELRSVDAGGHRLLGILAPHRTGPPSSVLADTIRELHVRTTSG